ncbi:hypothetical protein O181_115677 [Austropuccinia psidii MF-1]|uniref:Reverse transcriptase Ty1/copia-type domain-containing protein n=1 Tax=Austropuccinia psidii MF-1 TaxID=1389203 RepID=A0A9Q3PXL9_9BASI|nr:hypothetical protein [Austropuccinia psidii MF-1]
MLGIKINHHESGILLDQQHFIEALLEQYGMTQCKTVNTPLVPHCHLTPATEEEINSFNELKINFRSAIGSINYLSSATRPDLSFLVSALLQYLEKPGILHWRAFLHILKYLNGTQELGLIYEKSPNNSIEAYCDADWGNCRVTRRSVTGYLARFGTCVILWKSRKQPTVSISTAEAKYKALCDLMSEILWLKQWSEEANILKTSQPIITWEDNQSCIDIANNDGNFNNKRMKHVDIQLHFIKEIIAAKTIELRYKPTKEMLANFLTKSVSHGELSYVFEQLRLERIGERRSVEY